jgi:polyketide biosynthesis 3-hydroxy-3-methylglutaryl-CoA synthase-like enzyme PksG
MIEVGIEAINFFGGSAFLNVKELAIHRRLDLTRFENLLMKEKTVSLPYEDPVSFAINAAKPIIDSLSTDEKNRIELLITCTESGIDFGKSMSTYIHHYLDLNRHCRLFEIKQACYSGTAGFQMAINFILSQVSPGAKALVIATDISRFMTVENSEVLNMDWSFAEPSSGAGAVALLISEKPDIFQVDVGANGYYGHEVMDTCRPMPDSEAGNSDISLISYLNCFEQAFLEYQRKVIDVDLLTSFDYLSFHTPFGGMVKGAHRALIRKLHKPSAIEIEDDFQRRVLPGMKYCQSVGNIMGATVFLSLFSTIDNGEFSHSKRIGIFSYGSGCCSEFYSGIVSLNGQLKLKNMNVKKFLDNRTKLTIEQYENILKTSHIVKFGTRNVLFDLEKETLLYGRDLNKKTLYLKEIKEFHRIYEWI